MLKMLVSHLLWLHNDAVGMDHFNTLRVLARLIHNSCIYIVST